MLETFFFLLVLSAVIEASVKTVERLKTIIYNAVKGQFTQGDMNKLLLLVISVGICVWAGIPVLDVIAQPVLGADFSFGVLGYVLTGLLIGRGANPLHEFIEKVKQWAHSTKQDV